MARLHHPRPAPYTTTERKSTECTYVLFIEMPNNTTTKRKSTKCAYILFKVIPLHKSTKFMKIWTDVMITYFMTQLGLHDRLPAEC